MNKTTKTSDKSKAKKIYNAVSTVALVLIFAFLVVVVSLMLVQKKNGGETQLFGYYMFDVLTDSMSGTIEKGEVIVAKKVEDKYALKVGDIITFVAPSGVLKGFNETHRIVEIVYAEDGSVKYYKTAGDKLYDGAIKVDDWLLPPENVKAVFVKKSAFVGGLKEFLSHWYGYIVIVVIPMCLVFALVIAGFVRDRLALEKSKTPKTELSDLSEEDKKKLLELVANDHACEKENPVETDENVKSNDGEETQSDAQKRATKDEQENARDSAQEKENASVSGKDETEKNK